MAISDSLPGVIVTRISVHDVDLNSAFIFSFSKESNPGTKFAIDPNTGVVFLAAKMKMIPNTIKGAYKHPACTECFDIQWSVNIIISSNTTYGYFNPLPPL